MILLALTIGAVVILVLLAVLWRVRDSLSTPFGRALSLGTMALLPAVWVAGVLLESDARIKKVSFCTGCHEMAQYGESLLVDDDESLPAVHYRNGLVPREKACYTCHSKHGLTGYAEAKLAGLHDIYVHYLHEVPERIHLRSEYPTEICLHCHAEAQSFLEGRGHQYPKSLLDDLKSGEVSCLECHDVAHYLEGNDED